LRVASLWFVVLTIKWTPYLLCYQWWSVISQGPLDAATNHPLVNHHGGREHPLIGLSWTSILLMQFNVKEAAFGDLRVYQECAINYSASTAKCAKIVNRTHEIRLDFTHSLANSRRGNTIKYRQQDNYAVILHTKSSTQLRGKTI
jgi:hypothetical protein